MATLCDIDLAVSESVLMKANVHAGDEDHVQDESLLHKRKAEAEDEEEDYDEEDEEGDEEEDENGDEDDEEEDGNEEDEDEDYNGTVDELPDYGDYEGSEQQQIDLEIYKKTLDESEGFEMGEPLRSKFFIGQMQKVDLDDPKDFYAKDCRKAVLYAIRQQNRKKDANLELVEVTKSNRAANSMYYATFLARNMTCGEADTYQTRVFRSIVNAKTEVELFRLESAGILQHLIRTLWSYFLTFKLGCPSFIGILKTLEDPCVEISKNVYMCSWIQGCRITRRGFTISGLCPDILDF
ncbi:uncharacterized protein LOC126661103 [Mercurialis annua]|uniref:uncharacterized protein LOC126661103 n=1 Tax=Mercurialis annua TaxID=3986 RepID=UPI0024AE963D|nr:uncharacterized protein LOC126661103 [Mercurialis annua]